ncbi:AC60 [Alphabaculovirus altermyunipunctae]|jgi:cation transport regulator|uniref:AC60 n=1 Tax=Mythimna unipuncta nucleopolyhedrovirus TaxID=447897 RepID=A0A346TPJ2_9ABAC|nr:AC60 [Mythimna unipuncta nucleopolyhedrovirus]AXU41502.1 AC60 [Mythimna unipuncta nucleopolyhedrovirus]
MPYTSVNSLPSNVRKLPYHGRRIFLKVFNSTYDTYGNESKSFRYAWAAVNKKYMKRNGKWVARPDANEYDTTTTEEDDDDDEHYETETDTTETSDESDRS